ncbi:PAS domain S-box protein [Leptothermofonsia sp. ETS-13]|uniref:PAS domain S-box protein n=1 Tax=Leptothermofonsia sp. ETS-13 TaxID=3035696 RepID=UPI003BA19C38
MVQAGFPGRDSLIQNAQSRLLIVAFDTPVMEVVQCMSQMEVGCALVLEQEQLIGLVTEQDVMRAIAHRIDLDSTPISAFMTRPVVTLDESEMGDLGVIWQKFRQSSIRYLPVLNQQGQVTGIIPVEKLQCAFIEHLQATIAPNTTMSDRKSDAEPQQVEEALRQTEEQLHQIIENIEDIFLLKEVGTGKLLYVNQLYEQVYQHSCEALYENPASWLDRLHPDDRDRIQSKFEQELKGEEFFDDEYRIVRPDGSIRWLWDWSFPIYNRAGQIYRYAVVHRDITERKNLELALQEKEQFLRSIYETVEEGVFVIDVLENGDFRYVGLNPAHSKVTGLSTEDIQGKTPEQVLPTEDAASARRNYQSCVDAGATISYVEYMPFLGQDLWWLTHLTPLRDQHSRIYRIVGTSTNITEFKQIENALRQSEEQFRAIFEHAEIGIAVMFPPHFLLAQTNPALHNILGYSAAELMHLDYHQITHPEDIAIEQPFIQEILEGKRQAYRLEKRYIHKSGHIVWGNLICSVVINAARQIQMAICMIEDITKRKIAETALRQSEAKFRRLTENVPGGIFRGVVHSDGSYLMTYVSPQFCAICELTTEAALQASVLWSIVHPEDVQLLQDSISASIKNLQPFSTEFRLLSPSGQVKWIQAIARPERQPSSDVVYDGVILDISDRKRVEQEIWFQANLLNQVRNAVICTDLEGTIIYWNRFAETLYQWTADEVIGRSLFEVIVLADQQEVIAAAFAKLQQNQCTEGEFLLQRKDGSTFPVLAATSALQNKQGQYIGYVGVSIDISDRKHMENERKQAEVQLQKSLREKEVLLREIHHRVKNNLQIVSSLLHLQANRVDDPQLRSALENSWNRVDSMALVHENLYRSSDLSGVNFTVYVPTLVNNLSRVYNIQPQMVTLHLVINPAISLQIDQAVPCGLILNELLSNALKHGFRKKQTGELFVNLDKADQQITIAVGNSGDTLPPDFDLNQIRSMGLQLVMGLVKQLEGTLEVTRGNSTVFKVTFESFDL